MADIQKILKERLSQQQHEKLMAVDNPSVHAFVADAIELTNPKSVFVCTDSPEDIAHVGCSEDGGGALVMATSFASVALALPASTVVAAKAIPSLRFSTLPATIRAAAAL